MPIKAPLPMMNQANPGIHLVRYQEKMSVRMVRKGSTITTHLIHSGRIGA
jgi:hypothetical protein